jgi:hypothetical protein
MYVGCRGVNGCTLGWHALQGRCAAVISRAFDHECSKQLRINIQIIICQTLGAHEIDVLCVPLRLLFESITQGSNLPVLVFVLLQLLMHVQLQLLHTPGQLVNSSR